jgi:hypothetical protein
VVQGGSNIAASGFGPARLAAFTSLAHTISLPAFVDRRNAGVHDRGMHLDTLDMGVKAHPALVAGDDLHHRGLAHHHRRGARQGHHHRIDHRRRAGAPDLLVIAERELQRPLHAAFRGLQAAQIASASKPFMSQVPRP